MAPGAQVKKSFGGIETLRQATVQLSSMNPAPYAVNEVDRKTVFTFDPGRPAFELTDPDVRRWVMQTRSQTVDGTLSLDVSPLRVATTTEDAHVTQDDLGNNYSLVR
jgi:hypothetical protein